MAIDLLGETLDIHCGGIDLIFPHHEDEIAQSEAATGRTFSRFWCHGAFLLTEGAKMAKRLGNVATVKDMRESRIPAAAIRRFVYNTHYRKELNLTEDGLLSAIESVQRVGKFAERLTLATGGTTALAEAAEQFTRDVESALFDDLNAPQALAAVSEFMKHGNAELDRGGSDETSVAAARAAFARANSVLDIVPEPEQAEATLQTWVEERLEARRAARAKRDFATADQIRQELAGRDVLIEDTPQGTKWRVGR
jgi:cysteinyl-tRNA synthetase